MNLRCPERQRARPDTSTVSTYLRQSRLKCGWRRSQKPCTSCSSPLHGPTQPSVSSLCAVLSPRQSNCCRISLLWYSPSRWRGISSNPRGPVPSNCTLKGSLILSCYGLPTLDLPQTTHGLGTSSGGQQRDSTSTRTGTSICSASSLRSAMCR